MEPLPGCNIKYLNISRNDEAWGLVVTTAGYQAVAAHSSYPQAQHPDSHIFDPGKGRVLKEYPLVYICLLYTSHFAVAFGFLVAEGVDSFNVCHNFSWLI